jgi:hypothetical protein
LPSAIWEILNPFFVFKCRYCFFSAFKSVWSNAGQMAGTIFVPTVSPRQAYWKRSASICQGQIKINSEKLRPFHVFQQVALIAASGPV